MKRMGFFLLALGSVVTVLVGTSLQLGASVIAPPSDLKTFTSQADVIVVGTFAKATERVWDEGRFKKLLTELHFNVTSLVKADVRSGGVRTIIATSDTPDDVDVTLFKPGQEYILFLKWEPHFQVYGLNYGLSGAYVTERDRATPLSPNTDLVKKHGRVSRAQFVALVRQAAAK